MNWKELPGWLKSGGIGGVFGIIIYLVNKKTTLEDSSFFLFTISYPINISKLIAWAVGGFDADKVSRFQEINAAISIYLFTFILYFLIGTIIGLIIVGIKKLITKENIRGELTKENVCWTKGLKWGFILSVIYSFIEFIIAVLLIAKEDGFFGEIGVLNPENLPFLLGGFLLTFVLRSIIIIPLSIFIGWVIVKIKSKQNC